jgi:hypothetical protein
MPDTERLPSRDQAWGLLCQYTEKEGLRKHALAVEAAIRYYARPKTKREEAFRPPPVRVAQGVLALTPDPGDALPAASA